MEKKILLQQKGRLEYSSHQALMLMLIFAMFIFRVGSENSVLFTKREEIKFNTTEQKSI